MSTVPRRHSAGFTLIEVVMTIVVLGIIAAVGAQILTSGVDVYTATNTSLETSGKALNALERIKREIRQTAYTGTAYDIASMTSGQLRFTKRDGETVTIAQAVPLATLRYQSLGVTAPLLDNITNLTFSYFQADGQTPALGAADVAYVGVALTLLNDGVSLSREARVALRDKP